MEFIKNNLADTISLLLSILALIISSGIVIKGWWRHRNIYGIELHNIFDGGTEDEHEVNKKLSSGNYTILHTEKKNFPLGSGYQILLGKIKK